jgi:hypothetical protein
MRDDELRQENASPLAISVGCLRILLETQGLSCASIPYLNKGYPIMACDLKFLQEKNLGWPWGLPLQACRRLHCLGNYWHHRRRRIGRITNDQHGRNYRDRRTRSCHLGWGVLFQAGSLAAIGATARPSIPLPSRFESSMMARFAQRR